MGKRKRYYLKHERVVFLTKAEREEIERSYQDYLKAESMVCYYVFVGGSENSHQQHN